MALVALVALADLAGLQPLLAPAALAVLVALVALVALAVLAILLRKKILLDLGGIATNFALDLLRLHFLVRGHIRATILAAVIGHA